jgi:hypothetical protein
MVVNAIIVFQEFKKENPQKFDNLPVHFGQLEFRESFVKSLLGLEDKYWLDLSTPNIPSL